MTSAPNETGVNSITQNGHRTTPTHDNGRICAIGEKRDITSFGDGIDSTKFDVQPARSYIRRARERRNIPT